MIESKRPPRLGTLADRLSYIPPYAPLAALFIGSLITIALKASRGMLQADLKFFSSLYFQIPLQVFLFTCTACAFAIPFLAVRATLDHQGIDDERARTERARAESAINRLILFCFIPLLGFLFLLTWQYLDLAVAWIPVPAAP
jgi:hypothetical protein